jgi:hypothetical protein
MYILSYTGSTYSLSPHVYYTLAYEQKRDCWGEAGICRELALNWRSFAPT